MLHIPNVKSHADFVEKWTIRKFKIYIRNSVYWRKFYELALSSNTRVLFKQISVQRDRRNSSDKLRHPTMPQDQGLPGRGAIDSDVGITTHWEARG
jgi:hypothetical protein